MIDEHTIAYDSSKHDFQSIFKRIFEVTDLQSVHLAYPSLDEQLTFEKDTKNHSILDDREYTFTMNARLSNSDDERVQ